MRPLHTRARPGGRRLLAGGAAAGIVLAVAVAFLSAQAPPRASATGDPVIAAAGDIACDPTNGNFRGGAGTSNACRQLYTSNLLVGAGLAAVLPLGDNQYDCGGFQAFQQSYDQSWGRVKPITRPAVGNHEYITSGGGTGCDPSNQGAAGYFNYFGAGAGNPGQGYYSYDVGTWHLIALNSNCSDAGGCSAGSPQGQWLTNDLATHPNACTLAYWHIPLFSSGGRAAQNSSSFWQALYAAGADVVLNGHDHIYERFFPQSPTGQRDDANGIREFIVGTGGANHTSIASVAPNSAVRDISSYGVLKLTLHPGGYDWQFVPEAAGGFTESGTASCVGADTTPPSTPGNLSASPSQTSLALSWSPSSDNVGVTGYNVYLGGNRLDPTGGTSYAFTGLSCGTSYDLAVEAFDAAGNLSARAPLTASTSPCPPPALFGDGFESGNLSRWTANLGLVADSSQAHSGSFGARASSGPSGGAAWAWQQLPAEQGNLDYTLWFKLLAQGANVVDLLKLRTANGTAVLTMFASPTGVLGYQNNVTTLSTYSRTAVSPGVWHKLELHVVINGAASQTQTWLDDQPVPDLSKSESLGTAPLGRIQLGENIAGRSYDVAFDDVSVFAPDTTPPSTPGNLSASPSQTSLALSWSPSSDNVGVTGYNVYLGGNRLDPTGGTSYAFTGLSCGTSYDLAVEAFDAAGNLSARAPLTASTSPCPPPALFGDGFESGNLSRWTANLGLVADSSQAHSGSFGARASSGPSGGAAWAWQQLPAEQGNLDYTLWFKLLAQGANVVDLLKLRTANGTAVLTMFASPTGVLGYQNNVTTLSTYSRTAVSPGVWHKLELHVVINGAASQTQTWLDDQPVPDLSKSESLGTAPLGRIQLGENIAGRSYDVAFDDVSVVAP